MLHLYNMLESYVILGIIIFGMNIIPAFMPPTWSVLVFFYLTYNLKAFPVVIIGAVCATLGRVALYYLTQKKFLNFFSNKSKKNLDYASKFFNKKKHITIPLMVAYAFSPIPSNQAYIFAGLTKIKLRYIAPVFFIMRLLSYSAWIGTAHLIDKNLPSIFENYYSRGATFLIEIIGILLIIVILNLNWKKYLKI